MQIILLERIENLGQMGDIVTVKNGYARNYLLPQEKALRASRDNIRLFESQKSQLEATNLKKKKEAEKAAEKVNGTLITMIRQASENGQLFGSVRSHDICEALEGQKISVEKNQIMLSSPLKQVGLYPVRIKLHPEVDATISVNIAKSEDDADAQRLAEEGLVMAVDSDENNEDTHKQPVKAKKAKAQADQAEAPVEDKESTPSDAA